MREHTMQGREGAAAVATSVAAAAALLAAAAAAALLLLHRRQKEFKLCKSGEQQKFFPEVEKTEDGLGNVRDGILGAIGNTPLIRIRSLSEATGCEVMKNHLH